MGTLTQGSRSGSCRWRRPGLESNAPMGLSKEEAAYCRFINVQPQERARGTAVPRRTLPARIPPVTEAFR